MVIALSIFGLILLAAFLALWRLKVTGATLYWFTNNGFRAFSVTPGPQPHAVDETQLKSAIRALLARSGFYHLIVSAHSDPESPEVTLESSGQDVFLSSTFLALVEGEEKGRTVEAMKTRGLELVEESDWNVGLGPHLESVIVKFRVGPDEEVILELIQEVLTLRGAPNRSLRFVSALDLSSFPSKSFGPRVEMPRDPLAALFGSSGPRTR